MTTSPARRDTGRAGVAAAFAAVLAGCASPTGPASISRSSRPSPSVASSTPTGVDPARTAEPGWNPSDPGAPATAAFPVLASPDPRLSLDPAAAVSTAPYPHGRRGIPAGGLPALSTRTSRNPDVVARAALRVLFGSDTTLDAQPMDADKRALPWLGGPFAAAVGAAQIVAAPGAVWNGWAAHRAHLVVTVARGYTDGAPPDTPTAVYRQWTVTQNPVGADHWTGSPVRFVVAIQLIRAGGRWQLTRLLEENQP